MLVGRDTRNLIMRHPFVPSGFMKISDFVLSPQNENALESVGDPYGGITFVSGMSKAYLTTL